jgi:hypothetical protein
MVTFARKLSLHTAAAAVVTLGFACGAGLAVATDVKFDEFEQYESAFMSACTAWSSDRTCSCAMAAIEDKVGFEQFAQATMRTNGDIFNDRHLDRTATRAVESCSTMETHAGE